MDAIAPRHYTRFAIQPITFISENHLDFLAGNVIKYVCRHDLSLIHISEPTRRS